MCKDSAPLSDDVRISQRANHDGIIAPDARESSRNAPKNAMLRVLVVDDHTDMLDMMEVIMRRRSFEVAKATSGEEAVKMASDFSPHVIVSDISMPGMDGYEMMSTLRGMRELAGFKSIALSGYDAHDEHDRAMVAGYDAQLTKPVDFEQLLQTIATLGKAN